MYPEQVLFRRTGLREEVAVRCLTGRTARVQGSYFTIGIEGTAHAIALARADARGRIVASSVPEGSGGGT